MKLKNSIVVLLIVFSINYITFIPDKNWAMY